MNLAVTDRPCSCGGNYCPWNAAAEVIAQLDEADAARLAAEQTEETH